MSKDPISWGYLLKSYFGLRYWVVRRGDLDHALMAGELAPAEQRDSVVNARLAAAGQWRWRWQHRDGSSRIAWRMVFLGAAAGVAFAIALLGLATSKPGWAVGVAGFALGSLLVQLYFEDKRRRR